MDWLSFPCSACQQPLRARTEFAGRRVKCSKCGGVTAVPSAAPAETQSQTPPDPAPPSHEPSTQPEQRGSVLRRHVDPDDTIDDSAPLRTNPWPKVRLGLLLLIVSVGIAAGVLLINGVILRLFGYGTYGSRSFAEYIAFVQAVAYITSSLNVLNAALAIAGYVLCLFVPPRSAPRPLAIAALAAALVISPLQEGLTWFGPYAQRKVQQRAAESEALLKELNESLKGDPAQILEKMEEFRKRMAESREPTIVVPPTWYVLFLQLLPFLAFTQHLFFLLFLRSLCVSLRDQELADQCVKLLIAEGALLVVAFLVGLIPQLMMRSGNLSTIRTVGTFITIFQWLITLAALGILTWYFYVLMCARALVPDRSGGFRPRRRRQRSA